MTTTLITGASSGIGRSLAELCARDRSDLVLVARRADRLARAKQELEERYRVKAHVVALDLAAAGAAQALFDQTRALNVDIDALINNAGFGQYVDFVTQPLERIQAMIHLNVLALTELTRLYVERMRERGRGRVLQVSSTAAFQPGPRMAVYYATKAYVLSFSEALAVELEGSGVTVTTLCPGPTESEFNALANFVVSPLVEKVIMTSAEVADIGYRAMQRGDRLVVAGTRNKITAVASQLGPRSLVLSVTDKLLRSRR